MAQAQRSGEPHRADDDKNLAVARPQLVSEPPADQPGGLLVDFQEAADIGKRKKEQQDAHGHLNWSAQPNGRAAGHLFVVADGVSMGQAGALASRTAVDVMLNTFQKQLDAGQADFSVALAKAFQAANNEVYQLSRSRSGMATTCVAALVCGQQLITIHAGDSRIYLSRSKMDLIPVTVDHSWLTEMGQLLVQQGVISHQDMLRDQRRHTITRAFGLQLDMNGDVNAAQLQPGDLILLCSDGLWDMLPTGFLEQATREPTGDLPTMSKRLVDAAMDAGGRDNITLTLVRAVRLAEPVPLPALNAMLERTAREVAERTRPIRVETNQRQQSAVVSPTEKALASAKAYQPMGVVDQPDEEAGFIDDVPSAKIVLPNPELLLSKAQQEFALGEWNDAIDNFIQLELLEASFTGLYESFSNSLVRYIGVAIGEGQLNYVEELLKKLDNHKISRYNELLADYCNEEGRRAATAHYYATAKSYAQFCLKLRANDVRARNQIEMCDLYLALQRRGAPLNERLALAQKIYARDENFGSIQDDLAQVYIEMGNEAVRQQSPEDALGWYSMVLALRPANKQTLSLANTKHRDLQEELARRRGKPFAGISASYEAPTLTNPPATSGPTAQDTSRAAPRPATDNKTEQEQILRIKERVSRAQKAWDSGRKEVGGEYIYLVDQLNELATPNLWQPTFPRVCYDYGKWLLEQKQYTEARPYFQKAQQLGMTAAQQRLNEIDRMLRERGSTSRTNSLLDLPDEPLVTDRSASRSTFETPSEQTKSFNMPNLFPTHRSSSTPISPIVPPRPPTPSSNFVGASHAGDGVLTSNRVADPAQNPNVSSDPNTLPPRSAAAIAAGNWNRQDTEVITPLVQTTPIEQATITPTVRQAGSGFGKDPLSGAAQREAGRMAGTGLPQSHNPARANRQRWNAFGNWLKSILVPLLVAVIVIAGIIFSLILILPRFSQKDTNQASTQPTAIVEAGSSPLATTAAPAPLGLSGPQGLVRIDGLKAEDVRVFLADAGNPNSPYRELNQENGLFRLPMATLNRLDPKQKYLVVVRPKDTADRSYASNLSPDNPYQQPFTSPNFDFDLNKGFDMMLKITPEALGFYPLQGSEADRDIPEGRYIGAFHHTVRGDFFKFYNANGGLGRFGLPLSEEFDWTGNGHVQFFERGWLVQSAATPPVTIGKVGKMLIESSCSGFPRLPANITPLAVPTLKPDPDFDKVAASLKLGGPQSQPFETGGLTKTKVQYFEAGRLELNLADKKATPTLGLVGAEYARCVGWLK